MTSTNKKRWIRIGILILILTVCVFLYSLRGVLWPFIFAFFIAYILDPWVEFLQSKRFPRIVAVLTVLVGVTLAVVLAIILLFPMVSQEAAKTVSKFPQYLDVIRTKMAPWVQNWISNHPELAGEAEKYFNVNIRPAIPRLINPVLGYLASMFSSFAGFIIALLNLLLVPVLTFYILLDFLNLKQKAIELMPPRHQEKVIHYFNEVDEALSGYLRGQLSVAIALGVIYTIGLLILGVPLAIPVGLISGLGNMVPYLGFVLGIAASMLLSFLDNQDWHRLVWIVLLYTFAQVNEGTWLGPLLVGKRTGLHPVVIMLALVVGGTLFGLMGMLLAVPFVSVAVVFLRAAYRSYLVSDWYRKGRVAEIAPELEEP